MTSYQRTLLNSIEKLIDSLNARRDNNPKLRPESLSNGRLETLRKANTLLEIKNIVGYYTREELKYYG